MGPRWVRRVPKRLRFPNRRVFAYECPFSFLYMVYSSIGALLYCWGTLQQATYDSHTFPHCHISTSGKDEQDVYQLHEGKTNSKQRDSSRLILTVNVLHPIHRPCIQMGSEKEANRCVPQIKTQRRTFMWLFLLKPPCSNQQDSTYAIKVNPPAKLKTTVGVRMLGSVLLFMLNIIRFIK